MNKLYLRPNPTRENTLRLSANVALTAKSLGLEVLASQSFSEILKGSAFSQVTFCDADVALRCCDFAVVIGGDGTILRLAEDAAKEQKPVLGINVGTIGFMSELEVHELWELEKIKKGEFWLDNRMMLDVEVHNREGDIVFSACGLNDAVISKGVLSRVIKLNVRVNGQQIVRLSGDGVIICTPTGSTAYSLSAGGPILEPSSDCIAVTPICSHLLNAKSFVLSAEKEITVSPPEQDNPVHLSVDGYRSFEIDTGDSIIIRKSCRQFSLIRLKSLSFYEIISKKLSNERTEV